MSEGLRERPGVPADVLAAITDAAERAITAERGAAREPAWRFSGRWFSAHPIRARSRPS